MGRPLVVFADAQVAAVTVLRTALQGRSEDCVAGVQVGTLVPGDRSPEVPRLPYVLVRKDVDLPHSSMANSRVTLRVTIWHKNADLAHDLAMLCQALLIVHSGPVIRGVRPGTGPIAAVDNVSASSGGNNSSGVDLSTFTVLANVRPQLLTA